MEHPDVEGPGTGHSSEGTMANSEKKILVIDCDPGTDDVQAILIALSRSDVEIKAITAVVGNATVDHAFSNILRLLTLCSKSDIPVYKGSREYLHPGAFIGGKFHGEDGLGGVASMYPIGKFKVQKELASEALVRIAKDNTGKLTLVALGPLTNIAKALELDKNFGANLKDCVIMGGNTTGRGNVTACAEFNFYSDPEAAYNVLDQLRFHVTIVPLELCLSIAPSWEWYDEFIKTRTEKAEFVKNVEESIIERERAKKRDRYPLMYDQLAVAVAVDPKVTLDTKYVYAMVEREGELSRGMLVVDGRDKPSEEPNVKLVTKVDQDRLIALLHEAIGKPDKKVVIDCDAGTDDVQAIMIALSQPHVKVVAITAVASNANMGNTFTNIRRVLNICNKPEIPVYKGCSAPLRGGAFNGGKFEWGDGLVDDTSIEPSNKQEDNASKELVRIAKENKGELTLVALGPLTNIAEALLLDKDFGANLKDCVIMGGNTTGRGNETACAEFNFYSDPEAAHFVLNHLQCPPKIVPLELCLSIAPPWKWYDEFIKTSTKKAHFVEKIERPIIKEAHAEKRDKYPLMYGQLALAVAVDPTVAIETHTVYATMECSGNLTRGMLVVDWQNKLGKKPNVKLVNNADQGRLIELLLVAVGKD